MNASNSNTLKVHLRKLIGNQQVGSIYRGDTLDKGMINVLGKNGMVLHKISSRYSEWQLITYKLFISEIFIWLFSDHGNWHNRMRNHWWRGTTISINAFTFLPSSSHSSNVSWRYISNNIKIHIKKFAHWSIKNCKILETT